MLIDLPARFEGTGWGEERRKPERLFPGVYLAHLNFHIDLIYGNSGNLIKSEYPDFTLGHHRFLSPYGVCDHWTQLPLEKIKADPRSFLIYLTLVRKFDQPETYGWRWHKWGPYIGVHDIDGYEYLYDTPLVDRVYLYHVVEMVDCGVDDA